MKLKTDPLEVPILVNFGGGIWNSKQASELTPYFVSIFKKDKTAFLVELGEELNEMSNKELKGMSYATAFFLGEIFWNDGEVNQNRLIADFILDLDEDKVNAINHGMHKYCKLGDDELHNLNYATVAIGLINESAKNLPIRPSEYKKQQRIKEEAAIKQAEEEARYAAQAAESAVENNRKLNGIVNQDVTF